MGVDSNNQKGDHNFDLENALSTFERLSLKNLQNSSTKSDDGNKTDSNITSCRFTIRYTFPRFRPYAIPRFFFKRSTTVTRKNQEKIVDELDIQNIQLNGCDFADSVLPLFPLPDVKQSNTSARPCWLQYEQTAEYAGGHGPAMASCTSTSSSDSEISFEIDELSEYFQHFVNVRLKMSMQAESMYV